MFLSSDSTTVMIWSEEEKLPLSDFEVINASEFWEHDITSARWSKSRSSVFYCIKATGELAEYDLLNFDSSMKTDETAGNQVLSHQVTKNTLTASTSNKCASCLAIGDEQGGVHLVSMNANLFRFNLNEKEALKELYQRFHIAKFVHKIRDDWAKSKNIKAQETTENIDQEELQQQLQSIEDKFAALARVEKL